jgi:hypothetical protein
MAPMGTVLAGSGSMQERDKSGPLDGSTSGTIGGGGPETGGPTERPEAPAMPKVKPEDAASGRLAPDTIGATADPDELGPGPSDVSSVK